MPVAQKQKKKWSMTFPWWCLFIAYGISLIFAAISIFFIIARGIEFGDLKTQKWLTSLLSGFFSSILLIQPLKVRSVILKRKKLFNEWYLKLGVGFADLIFISVSRYEQRQRSRWTNRWRWCWVGYWWRLSSFDQSLLIVLHEREMWSCVIEWISICMSLSSSSRSFTSRRSAMGSWTTIERNQNVVNHLWNTDLFHISLSSLFCHVFQYQ